jgi:hypothetical protein
MGDRSAYKIWWEDLMEKDHLEDPGVEGRKIIKWFLKKWDGEAWTVPYDKDACECGNEPSCSIKCEEFLD